MTKQPNSISDNGLDLIKLFEGLRLNSYQDEGGVWTIGYGHTRDVKRGQTITEAQAHEFLKQDVLNAEKAIKLYVKVPLSQFQFDALGSWTFNLGSGNLRSSTLLKKLNAGDYSAIPAEIIRWNKVKVAGKFKVSKGLVRRRTAEAALWSMDTPLASEGGETMPQKPRAVNAGTKPLKKSRTLAGLSIAGIGVALAQVQEQITPFLGVLPYSEYISAGLSIAGIAIAAYARIDDHIKAIK